MKRYAFVSDWLLSLGRFDVVLLERLEFVISGDLRGSPNYLGAMHDHVNKRQIWKLNLLLNFHSSERSSKANQFVETSLIGYCLVKLLRLCFLLTVHSQAL
jgi:hypothetical protein